MSDNLNTLFKNLEGTFDVEDPGLGHQQRFLDKLNNKGESIAESGKSIRSLWRPLTGIAASIALLVALFVGFQNNSDYDLASISPEMANTQDFFTNAITTELEKLNSENDPEFQDLIVDALFQIEILEQNYILLKQDLSDSGDDKRVIYAMISNFQSRIDLLENVIQQIEDIKLNTTTNENSITL